MSLITDPATDPATSVLLVGAGDSLAIVVWAAAIAAALLLVTAVDWALTRIAHAVVRRLRDDPPEQEPELEQVDDGPRDRFARWDR